MQSSHSQIQDEPNPATQSWERNIGELQEAVSRHLPLFHRRAYRYLGNSHDAEDAVQDALLSAYMHLDQFKGRAKMTTWITSIVINSALTQLRKRPRQLHSSLDERLSEDEGSSLSDRLVDAKPSPEDECADSELRGHLMQLLKRLSPAMQKAVKLRDFDDLTTSEAAQILRVPESTVKTRVSRARAELKRQATRSLKRRIVIAEI